VPHHPEFRSTPLLQITKKRVNSTNKLPNTKIKTI
jgi:hypothetical protein